MEETLVPLAQQPLIQDPLGVTAVLAIICGFWFMLEQRSGWRVFNYLPPLLWIYATPLVLSNLGIIGGALGVGGQDVLPSSNSSYDWLRQYGLPIFIVLMLIKVDVAGAVRVMGRGVGVMLLGTAGIMVGGVVSYVIVSGNLDPDAWKGFGALAGSWIGGTGNMAAAAQMLETPPDQFGLAILADNVIYVIWLPILLGSKAFADRFNRWARVPEDRLAQMDAAAAAQDTEEAAPGMRDLLYLGAITAILLWTAQSLAPLLPEVRIGGENLISSGTWKILCLTTFALILSTTPVRRLPGATAIATALIYVFVAGMGARAELSGLDQAPWFIVGAFIWIFIHGAFVLFGAWLLKVDVHSAAIASAANVGGAASAPVVAAYHRQSLIPASILMALIGYAIGNYLAFLTGQLARLASGG
ncbi:MAG: DUF819 family protein [Wenzhouxiangellaceae bacterium]